MINLAQKDIKHGLGKFVVTAMGVGILLGVVLLMTGLFRGMIVDAESLLNDIQVDLWVVQDNTEGPFAQNSQIHEDLKDTLKVIDGVQKAEAITFYNTQLPALPKAVRVVAVGYDPYGDITPINPNKLIQGRAIEHNHYEIVVSQNTGFNLNETINLGREQYKVVGVTKDTVSSSGAPLVFISLKDAQDLQFSYTNTRIRNDRERGIINRDLNLVNAIIIKVKKGYLPEEVAKNIERDKHKSVYTKAEQKYLLTKKLLEKASMQIGMFAGILVISATIIISLIIYTMTLEKIKVISIMKLIGIPNRFIIKMIVQETLLLGVLAFIFAYIFSHLIYHSFPKTVVLQNQDAFMLFIIIVITSILASFTGIRKAINANPTEAIGG